MLKRLKEYFELPHLEKEASLVVSTRSILWILEATAFLLLFDDVWTMQGQHVWLFVTFAAGIAAAIGLTFLGDPFLPRFLVPILLAGLITSRIALNDVGIHNLATHCYPAVIVLSGLLLGKRAPLLFAGLCIALIAGLCHAEISGWIPSQFLALTTYSDLFAISLVLVATGGVTQVLMNTLAASVARTHQSANALQRANRQLQERTQQLEEQETALEESNERYHSLFNRSVIGVYVHDLNGQFLDANETALTWFGYTREHIHTLNISDFLDEAQMLTAQASMAEILRTGYESVPRQYQITHRDGRVIWLETEGSLLYKNGEPYAIHGIAHDITERKQAETAIQESEQKFRSITEQVQDVIFMTDMQATITYISPSSAVVFGWPAAEMLNQPFPVFLAERDVPLALTEFEYTLSTAQATHDLRLHMRRQDGTQFVGELRAALVHQNGVAYGTIGVIRDITERQRAEEHIRAALQEKEVLLREIHHRVKNNLQVISSLLHLQSNFLQDAQSQELFKESQHRVKSMALIHEKLYQSENLTNIDFKEYVNTLVHDLYTSYAAATGNIRFLIDVEETTWGIDTAIPCGLIINELVSNALKHAFPEKGGTVAIALHGMPESRYELLLSDDGIGMPKNLDIEQLGSLGLQLVKGLVEDQLEGEFHVQSTPEKGTAWRIIFTKP